MQELEMNYNYSNAKRLSMVDLQRQTNEQCESARRLNRHKRNSSIEGKSNQKSTQQLQSSKSIGLAFTKTKSRKSMFDSSCKENKQSQQNIDENYLKFSSFRPPRKRNPKSKFIPCQPHTTETEATELSLGLLEKQLSKIMECSVISQKRRVTLQQFVLLQKLGEGAYSSVFLAFQKQTRTIYAMKVIKREILQQQGNFQRLISQIKIQSFCTHPNIAKLYAVFSDQTAIYLLQQYAGRETLYSLMVAQGANSKMETESVVNYVSQLCSAICYLHDISIIHRDIKPQNILISPGGVVKIIDFGWSVHNPRNQLRKTFCGTPIYFSPQLLTAQYYDQTVDIWAIGVLTYELLTGSNPFNINCFQQLGKIISDQVDLSKIGDYKAKEFVSQLLIKERVLRKSMDDVCIHPFLTSPNKVPLFK